MATWQNFVEQFHDLFTSDPNDRVFLGIDKDLGHLPDPSMAHLEQSKKRASELLGQLAILTPTDDTEQQLDRDLAKLLLERKVLDTSLTVEGRLAVEQMPRAADEVGDGLFLMMAKDPRPDKERLQDIIGRLTEVPSYTENLLARTKLPLARWVSMDCQKIDGMGQLFESLVSWCEQKAPELKQKLSSALEPAKVALEDYCTKLTAMETSEVFAVGDKQAASLLRLRGIDHSPQELKQIAKEFLESTAQIIEERRKTLTAKYELDQAMSAADLHKWLNKKFAVKATSMEDVITRYQQEKDKIDDFLASKGLFPMPEKQVIEIMHTPTFLAPSIPAGAMMPPESFRDGVKKSLVYLTLREELLDEHTELSIPNMMIHEGIPGHHLQLSFAALHPSVIRKHVSANDQAEGWTTMLEDYVLDLGYLAELTDEARFCAKRDISRIGARVLIDLYFLTGQKDFLEVGLPIDLSGDDPFVNAGNLLQHVTGFVRPRVEAELNWYSQERAYPLCYLSGNHDVWQLKRDVQKAHPDKSQEEIDKVFHETYLNAGSMPVSFLRRYFEAQGLLGN